jgi:hypothetical protein
MITGGANFPVRRHEKANQSEHNKYTAFREWRTKALNAITRPESTDIVKGTTGAADKMRAKLAKLEESQNNMKTANKILRNKKLSDVEKIDFIVDTTTLNKDTAIQLLEPRHMCAFGYARFSLTNNSAKIRNLQKDINAEEAREHEYTEGNKEYTIAGVNICENVEQNRIQILFEDKPDEETRKKLKQNAFRWSPRNTAWQRQLTLNGIRAVKYVLK